MVPSKLTSEPFTHTDAGTIGSPVPSIAYIVGSGSVFGDSGAPSQWDLAGEPTPAGGSGAYHFVVEYAGADPSLLASPAGKLFSFSGFSCCSE
jgi:hypothetical protein